MVILSISIAILYLAVIAAFTFGFDKVKPFNLSDVAAKTRFSVVVPFRNEAENLPQLLKSITALNYTKQLFEIILVDDDSDDDSVKIIKEFIDTISTETGITKTNISLITTKKTSTSPKKDAITTAIKAAKYEWIITTDADCIVPKFWLDSFDEFIQNRKPTCIVAPVTYIEDGTFLGRFQLLDLFSLQGATIGGFGLKRPFLCNGANFAYTKSVFNTLNGFKGNTNIASGDDIFLLEKIIKKQPNNVYYLKCEKAIVSTKPQHTWQQLIEQRVRWAAKTSAYNNWFGKVTALIIFLTNFLIILLLLAVLGLFNLKIWVYILVIKLHIDFLLLYKTSAFFNQRRAFKSFLTSFFLYPFLTNYVALRSVIKGYQWKGRTFKK
ncbi:N-acetylglucosaminyltransferase [Jejuia pallidilutea]|uniref:N-acetylglucosaminyltransferase n=1 Tax=Jejuia pallidilutea TaxID=504487 RepID=A0A090VRW2_9FLAO|nr:glycosyltransferase [Jejuia pallidilutea]GAL66758.1 N-acetylglucosaminyltransferase [Jejuia pallidilutea]